MDKFWIGIVIIIVVGLLAGLAVLREGFFEASKLVGAFDIPIGLTTLVSILIIFNLAMLTVLTYLSYIEARKNPEQYRKAKKAYKEALKDVKERGGDVETVAGGISKSRCEA